MALTRIIRCLLHDRDCADTDLSDVGHLDVHNRTLLKIGMQLLG